MAKIDKSLAGAIATRSSSKPKPVPTSPAPSAEPGHAIKTPKKIHRTSVNIRMKQADLIDEIIFRHKKRTGQRVSLSGVIRAALDNFATLETSKQDTILSDEHTS